jgi:O-antigen/teichoic acid export membrane protein
LTKGATYLLAGALSSVLLPAMSRAFGVGGGGSVVRMLTESIRFYWFIGLAIAGMGVAVAPGAVRLLYGHQYEAAVPAVVVNLMVSGFVLISAAFNAFQTSSDQQGDRIKIAALTLCVNAVAALLLVPAFGLAGALGSLAVTKVASVCLSWLFVRHTEGMSMPASSMVRVFMAALAAVVLAGGFDMVVHGRFAFLGAGAVFVIGYLLCSVVLRAWTRSDFELVATVAGHAGKAGRRIGLLINAAGQRFSA